MSAPRATVHVGDDVHIHPGRDYLAVVRFDSDMPTAGMGMLVGHFAGLARDRINATYTTLSQFNIDQAMVTPWTDLRVRGQHVATIFFYVTPRGFGGPGHLLTAGQVRREILSVFRDNTGLGAGVVMNEVVVPPPPRFPTAPFTGDPTAPLTGDPTAPLTGDPTAPLTGDPTAPLTGDPTATPYAPATGAAGSPRGGPLPGGSIAPGGAQTLGSLLIVGLVLVGAVYFLGGKRMMTR